MILVVRVGSPGNLAEADRGTALVDGVGALALAAGGESLGRGESREFRPVGTARDRRPGPRVVSGPKGDVGRLVHAGRFRADLVEFSPEA